MTAPYTQQNYADWKARFQQTSAVGGLLRQAKQVAGIEDEPQPLLTPPFNPQAPQDPADLHEHQRGILGGLRHLVGADKTAPEVAALLTPDQQKRARPGLLSTVYNAVVEGKGPQAVQQERARQMIDLGDEKKARDLTAQQEATARRIEAVAATMSPQDGAEYAARMKGIYGLPTAQAAISAAVGLKEREFAPQRVTWSRTSAMVDGKPTIVLGSNDGQLMSLDGIDLRANGARVEPMPNTPQYGSGSVLPGAMNPDGTPKPPQLVITSGPRMGETIAVPDVSKNEPVGRGGFGVGAMRKQSVELQSIIDNAKAAIEAIEAYPDAFGPTRVSETANPHIDPKGNEARRLYGRLTSIVRHENFGTALSKNEAQTARSWIGRTYDPADKVLGDTRNLLRWAEAQKADLEGEVQSMDGRATGSRPPATPSGKSMTRAEFNQLSPAAQKAARDGGYTILP